MAQTTTMAGAIIENGTRRIAANSGTQVRTRMRRQRCRDTLRQSGPRQNPVSRQTAAGRAEGPRSAGRPAAPQRSASRECQASASAAGRSCRRRGRPFPEQPRLPARLAEIVAVLGETLGEAIAHERMPALRHPRDAHQQPTRQLRTKVMVMAGSFFHVSNTAFSAAWRSRPGISGHLPSMREFRDAEQPITRRGT